MLMFHIPYEGAACIGLSLQYDDLSYNLLLAPSPASLELFRSHLASAEPSLANACFSKCRPRPDRDEKT